MPAGYGAVDIGGTKIAIGVADADGNLLARDSFFVAEHPQPRAATDQIVTRIRQMATAQGLTLAGCGVACCGPLDPEAGLVLNPVNLTTWVNVPVVRWLEDDLGVPVQMEKDTNAAARAEYHRGAGQGARVMVYITVSTGIGGGLVVDGQVISGLRGSAGEVGHQIVRRDGALCGCGNRGCLEAQASGLAIAKFAREAIAAGGAKGILALATSPEQVHAGHVQAAAAAGDADAKRIWDDAMTDLATGIANVITILAPNTVVLGGGVTATGEALLAPVRAGVARQVHVVPLERVTLALAGLGADAGLVGAALLARGGAG